jgi:hypothetical protein
MGPVVYLKLNHTNASAPMPRGFMFKSDNLNFWEKVNNNIPNVSDAVAGSNASLVDTSKSTLVFKSYTNRSEYWELWFTKQHIHDQGAVKRSFVYLIPGIESYIGYEENILVNRTR